MGLRQVLVSADALHASSNMEKVYVNDRDIYSQEGKEKMDALILKNYADDHLSVIPSCHCGNLKAAYYLGQTCEMCGTKVVSSMDDNLAYLVWLRQPVGVEKIISPFILSVLNNRYRINKAGPEIKSYISYIMLPRENYINSNIKNLMVAKLDHILKANSIERGYNSFIRNFFKIIDILENGFVKAKTGKDKSKDKRLSESLSFIELLKNNQDKIFTTYMPFPNRIVFSMETNELGKFIDKRVVSPINCIRRVTGIDLHTQTIRNKELRVAKTLLEMSAFYRSYTDETFFIKSALVRQHIASTRCHFTARAVITYINGPHQYDEIHLPWSVSCTLFRINILNRLYARGYVHRTASNFLAKHNRIYHPLLEEIFNEILLSSDGGPRVLFNRNPSLHRGSVQTVRVTQFKTDVNDNTISFSPMITSAFNADIDGDQMNIMLILTKKSRESLSNFDPHHNVLGLTGPGEFSNNIELPNTMIATLSNWYHS